MSLYRTASIAPIGYKIKKGDWIILKTPYAPEKAFTVTHVTTTKAICKFPKRGKRRPSRNALKFPRYYSKPFAPLAKKWKPEHEYKYDWYVKINDARIKRNRFKHYDKSLEQ